ncbi:MAG: T9SS type A sorting domain-containing protein, partial [Ignavibacteriaceae bacterium]|nr:T9SS type A sorting domain-containing protein [Ignavibacteriaceae bacterium]
DIDASSSVDFDTYGEWTSNPCGGSSKITNDPHLAHSSLKKTVTDNLLSGQLLEKQGRIDDAVAFYLGLINNNDHVRFALLKLAFIMKKYSRPEITTSLENLLTTSNNNYCKIKNTLGNIYLQSNRFDDAITAFNDAIDHSSTDYDGINARFGKLFGYLNIGYNIPMASQVLSNIKGLNLTDNETLIRIKMAENLIAEAEHGEYKNSLTSKIDQPQSYELSQNYPNPFNPSTKINYQIPRAGNVSLKVYDILGRQIVTLVNEYKNEGRYSVNFNASRYASGVYIYQLRAGSFVSSKKMVLTK